MLELTKKALQTSDYDKIFSVFWFTLNRPRRNVGVFLFVPLPDQINQPSTNGQPIERNRSKT